MFIFKPQPSVMSECLFLNHNFNVSHCFFSFVVSLFWKHIIKHRNTPIATSCLLAYLLLQAPHRRTTMRTFICAIPCGNLESAFRETPEPETADGQTVSNHCILQHNRWGFKKQNANCCALYDRFSGERISPDLAMWN